MIRITQSDEIQDNSFWGLPGRKVISRYGNYSGRVIGVYFQGTGITALQILYRFRRIKISIEYVENFESLHRETSLLLSIEPSYLLIGRLVYDRSGRKLGQVRNISRMESGDEIQELVVRKGRFGRALRVHAADIETMKKNIILRREYGEARHHEEA